MNLKIHGVVVPILTPFTNAGKIDHEAIGHHVDFLVDRNVAGLYPGGTTGEGFLLRLKERQELAESVVKATDGRLPVIIHTGTPTTTDTVMLTQHARDLGAAAAAVIPPYVYRHSDEALFRHFTAVAQSVPDFPLLLYNFPAICNNVLTYGLIMRIVEHAPNIVGMKDSSGSLDTLAQLHTASRGAFLAFTGGDGHVLMSAAMGFNGCVSGNANVVPELMVALFDASTAGDLERARTLQRQVNAVRTLLGDGADLSLFKHMVIRRGIPVGDVRPPLLSASPETVETKWQQLLALDPMLRQD